MWIDEVMVLQSGLRGVKEMEELEGLALLEKLSAENPGWETRAYLIPDGVYVSISDLDEIEEPLKFGRVYYEEVITIDGVEYVYSADFDDMVEELCDIMSEDEDLDLDSYAIKQSATDIVKQYDWIDIIVVNVEILPV